jgi:2-oxoglutarate ferredoxin oxidoreductase subunit alpha
MKLNILFGGKAGQGSNIVGHIMAKILASQGFYIFQSRDYQSLIRGGHNFNLLTFSNEPVYSNESKIDVLVAMDNLTLEVHKDDLKEKAIVISQSKGNMYLAGCLIKLLGLDLALLEKELEKIKRFDENMAEAKEGYCDTETKINLSLFARQEIFSILTGNQAVAQGSIDSGLSLYFSYPMTPATGVMNELASNQIENNLLVFQSENEIAAINAALGASFSGARSMVGSSGGGFDLMAEALSFQGQTEIPLVVYLASRPGPSTGVPTYTSQGDLNAALYSGHGEFPRVVVAPGDPLELIEKTNESFYISEKFRSLVIIISDKHLAESEFSVSELTKPSLKIEMQRPIPGKDIVKTSSYEHSADGITTESSLDIEENIKSRLKKKDKIKQEIEKFEMFKIHGNRNSKNLVVGWGSTKGAVLDAINGLDVKFLQIIYVEPFSSQIKKELQKAEKIILIENNSTSQLGDLIIQKTGIEIKDKILKYDGRPFFSDKLNEKIKEILNGS